MTSLVRLCIKTSFVFLLLGLVLGGYVTVQVNLVGRGEPPPTLQEASDFRHGSARGTR